MFVVQVFRLGPERSRHKGMENGTEEDQRPHEIERSEADAVQQDIANALALRAKVPVAVSVQ